MNPEEGQNAGGNGCSNQNLQDGINHDGILKGSQKIPDFTENNDIDAVPDRKLVGAGKSAGQNI